MAVVLGGLRFFLSREAKAHALAEAVREAEELWPRILKHRQKRDAAGFVYLRPLQT